jgi:hypothetical protein
VKPDLPQLAEHILHTLLDRCEQPERQTVVRVRLSEQTYPAYYDRSDAGPRRATNQILQELATRGILELHWQKWEAGNWLAAVDLLPEQAEHLYELLQRKPHMQQVAELQARLEAQDPAADWFVAFCEWARQQLRQHRSPAPLMLNDPQWNHDLLRALDHLARLEQPVSERVLSVRLFNNSKRLAVIRDAIVAVLRRFDPQAHEFGDDARAILQAHMLQRIPEYVPIAGPLVLQRHGEGPPLDLRGFAEGLALPSSVLLHCGIQSCEAQILVTIENATSFHELLAIHQPGVLAIYSGGFAGPALIALLQRVRAAAPQVPCYHWGDLDPAGLRILAHLRQHLGEVRPLAMDAATLEQHRVQARPLSARERSSLQQLGRQPLLSDCRPLIEAMLASGCKLEQEAVAVPRLSDSA